MKISVITAVYNRSKTIKRAIVSVKAQIYQNIELVVIDGGSTDGTVAVIKPLLGKNDTFISEADAGIYDALNKGLKLASGEVIGLLHSDDLYFDDSVLCEIADAFADDSIDLVYGDVGFFSADNVTRIRRRYRSDKLSLRNLAWGKMPAHPAIFIRRRVYEEIGFFETDFKIAADYEFLCRVVRYCGLKSVYLSRVLVLMQLGGISTGGLGIRFYSTKKCTGHYVRMAYTQTYSC